MVIEIKDLLARFNNILLEGEGKYDYIRMAIYEATKIKIENKDIKIKNNIVYLNIKPIYKNKIFIKKEQIFQNLKLVLGKKTPENFW
ncbi:MAG: hypothetical protein M3P22_02700 [bacterium]|nr:hypothetical protein [bacterium]